MNKFKGEVEIKVGEEMLTLRPSYTAIVEIESKLGRAISELIGSAGTTGLTLREATIIIWAGNMATAPSLRLTVEQMGDKIVAGGYLSVMGHGGEKNTLARFLLSALGIDPDAPVVAAPAANEGNALRQTMDGIG